MVKSLSVMGITDSDFPMSSIIGRANLLLTTSIGGGVHVGIKFCGTQNYGRQQIHLLPTDFNGVY
ncbi:hypothetical protein EIL26_26390 [Salmonella enterica subsp. enterica serovar Newport]|nr:hypothetical protein [Salmonella enterica subsp. enterica serovar Panama]EAQ2492904.1 hypothetical protein [Salmonella enterica]ECA0405347.1 hypothetical protein [Salmonella enterica subsp. enterica serovar Newport]EAT6178937.1 hypothetical protein [Salmonella enterica]EAU4596659.1 hypothetical protein [Salmonella enterica]